MTEEIIWEHLLILVRKTRKKDNYPDQISNLDDVSCTAFWGLNGTNSIICFLFEHKKTCKISLSFSEPLPPFFQATINDDSSIFMKTCSSKMNWVKY